ncbi:putative transcriptional regulator with C-terminal CBS domains [Clostridium sp. CAG:768]|uniref:helix-turn-helix domain-containing protein n=1 Tax=Candidatus Stercorousia sp. TaxID=3048886 RepID=UPI0003371C58|nr:putative transcriptional regulator with C-terminal CBS domains [Clostridium sp. CAG:768]
MTNSTVQIVNQNIKNYRIANGLTQEKLADLCNISRDYISEIERGKKFPSLKRLFVIAEAMGIEAYKLLM